MVRRDSATPRGARRTRASRSALAAAGLLLLSGCSLLPSDEEPTTAEPTASEPAPSAQVTPAGVTLFGEGTTEDPVEITVRVG